jgi:FkbM family methyltransferase
MTTQNVQNVKRDTKLASLLLARQNGLSPRTVIDVGAAVGTPEVYKVFPDARHVMIEPLVENEPFLDLVCKSLPRAEYLIAAIGRTCGTTSLRCRDDLTYSQVCADRSNHIDGFTLREVRTLTLDALCADRQLQDPYLIKIDVDGSELDVIEGAEGTLAAAELVAIEATFFNSNVSRIVETMQSRGFALYDIVDFLYRPIDQALWQVDLVFVKDSSPLRARRNYALPTAPTPSGAASPSAHKTWRDHQIDAIKRGRL